MGAADDTLDEIEAELRRNLRDLEDQVAALTGARDRVQAALGALTGTPPPAKTSSKPKRSKRKPAAGDFPCDQCDRSFTTKQGRSKHITHAHSGTAAVESREPAGRPELSVVQDERTVAGGALPRLDHPCDEDGCGQSFFDEHAKRRHMRIVHKVHRS